MEKECVCTYVQHEEELEQTKKKKEKKKQTLKEQISSSSSSYISSSSSLSPSSSWRNSLKKRSEGLMRWQDKKEEQEDLPLPALVLRLSSSQDKENELSISSSSSSLASQFPSSPVLPSLSLSRKDSQEKKTEEEKEEKHKQNDNVLIDQQKKNYAVNMIADQSITSLVSSSSSSNSCPSLSSSSFPSSSSSSSCCPSYHTSRSTSCENIPPSSSYPPLPCSLSCPSGDSELGCCPASRPSTGEKKERLSLSEEEKEERREDGEREKKKHDLPAVAPDQSELEEKKERKKKDFEIEHLKEQGIGRNEEEERRTIDQQTLQHEEASSRVPSQEVSRFLSVEEEGSPSDKEEEEIEKKEGSLFNDKSDDILLGKARGEGGEKEEEEEEEPTTAITVIALHHYHHGHQSKVSSLSCASSGVCTPQGEEPEGDMETGDRKMKDLEQTTPQHDDATKPRGEDEKKEGERERQMKDVEGEMNADRKKKEDSTEEEVQEEEEEKKKTGMDEGHQQGGRAMNEERHEDHSQIQKEKDRDEQEEEEADEERRNKGRRVQELLSSTTQVMMQRLQILKESLITREEMIEALIARCREREEELKFLKELFPAIMSENLNLREELFHTKRSLSNANLLLKSNPRRRGERYGEKDKKENMNYQPLPPSQQIPFLRLPLSPSHKQRSEADDENERHSQESTSRTAYHLGARCNKGKGMGEEKAEEEEDYDKTACCIVNLDEEEDEDEEEMERRGGFEEVGDSSFSFGEVEYESAVDFVREREQGEQEERKKRMKKTRKKRRRKRIISPESQWWGIDEGVIEEEEEEEEEEEDRRMRKIDITPLMVDKSSQTDISFPHSHQTHHVSFDLSNSQRKRTSSSPLPHQYPSSSSSSSSLGHDPHPALCCSPSYVLPSPRCSSSSLLKPSAYATFIRWKYREKRRERKEGWRKRGSRGLTSSIDDASSSSSPLHVVNACEYIHPVHLSPLCLLLRGTLRRRRKLQDERDVLKKINILSTPPSGTVASMHQSPCSPRSSPAFSSVRLPSCSSFLDEEKNDEQWISQWLRLQFKSEFCLTPPESLSRDVSLVNTTSHTTSHFSPLSNSLSDSASFSSSQGHYGYQEDKSSLCIGEVYHRDVDRNYRFTSRGGSFERDGEQEEEEEQGRETEGPLGAEEDRDTKRETDMKREERQSNTEKQRVSEERDPRERSSIRKRLSPSALIGSKICWWWVFLLNPSGF